MAWIRGHTLGRGSSATVSLAMNLQSGEAFAVKSVELLRSEFLQREQRILSLLNSPRIVGYLGCDVTNENGQLLYNLFMEYVSGGTLTEAIQQQGGGLHESSIRSHTRAILEGLDYLHSHGLVHCDIKGRNILVGEDGTKIADLGCARWVEKKPSAIPIAGTPVFMAPEVARGDEQSLPADVWALGCTVIEMATGSPPWPDVADPVSALHRIAFSSDLPEFPSFLSWEAKDFLGKCLRRDPNERWTVHELLKHPFLQEGCLEELKLNRIQSSISATSPMSILDQGFWESLEGFETGSEATPLYMDNQLLLGSSSDSPAERIRRLIGDTSTSSSNIALPDWTYEDDEWVTIRRKSYLERVVSVDHDQTMMPRDESGETNKWSTADLISEEEEMQLLGRSSTIDNSVNNRSFSRSSEGNFSRACKSVRNVDVICDHRRVIQFFYNNFDFKG